MRMRYYIAAYHNDTILLSPGAFCSPTVFSLDPITGEIILTAPVNLDSQDIGVPLTPLSVILLVEAKDNLVHTTLLDITINFQYVNEFTPVFDATATAEVFENATQGQRIATVRCLITHSKNCILCIIMILNVKCISAMILFDSPMIPCWVPL